MKTSSLRTCFTLLTLYGFAGAVLLTVTGCDISDSGDASRNTLEINPRSTNILTRSSALFTVTTDTNLTVVLPLVWSVDNPNIGTIVRSAGQSAVYQSGSQTGVNTITVRDQGDKEGIARVTVENPEEPEPIIITNAPPVVDMTETEEPEPASQTVNIILPENGSASTTTEP